MRQTTPSRIKFETCHYLCKYEVNTTAETPLVLTSVKPHNSNGIVRWHCSMALSDSSIKGYLPCVYYNRCKELQQDYSTNVTNYVE